LASSWRNTFTAVAFASSRIENRELALDTSVELLCTDDAAENIKLNKAISAKVETGIHLETFLKRIANIYISNISIATEVFEETHGNM